ncbi:uncharacterized protein FA14DRAFT_160564 [Meira miltonrushii]|uniref:Ribonuclease H1 N-terminal domain-containing protein n=1 Tax=Meira miltonrushii TaxID=1280837 RepID=A0A316VHE5_9BASI|nr:uncharacterized protein FA14DRAFT_160564 [Meira miltonrushii]PWN35411.1 hypothetical protein FA14DRAFT_160564 [Meira miltonrushii]
MTHSNGTATDHHGTGFGETMRNLFSFKSSKRKLIPKTMFEQLPEISDKQPSKHSQQQQQRSMRSLPPTSSSPETVKMKRATVIVKNDDVNVRATTLPRRALSQRHPAADNRRSSQYWGPPPMQRSMSGRYADNPNRKSRIMMGLELEDEEAKIERRQPLPEGKPVSILVSDQPPSRNQRNFTEPVSTSKLSRSVTISAKPTIGRSALSGGHSPSPKKSTTLQRSTSVSSTFRARPRGGLPSAMEMQKRSSQFIGYWCPYPSTATESSPVPEKNELRFENELDLDYGLEDDEEIQLTAEEAMFPKRIYSRQVRASEKEQQMQELIHAHFASDSNPSSSSHGSPISISKSLPSSLAQQKDPNAPCWAVLRGWRMGVYSTREEAERQMENFPGPYMQEFPNEREARQWLQDGATDARRIPSVRTLELDEDFNHPSLSRMSLYERADVIEGRVKRAYSLRREVPRKVVPQKGFPALPKPPVDV